MPEETNDPHENFDRPEVRREKKVKFVMARDATNYTL